ncbi:MAG: DUF3006 domain-containing protein [Ruminococcus sp.]|nr:DUF3006 domain-containing protein [Ruminococcus sp.]
MIIDRFEGDIAVVETDEGFRDIPRSQLPAEAEEGDVLASCDGCYVVDKEAAERRRSSAASRMKRLMNKGGL